MMNSIDAMKDLDGTRELSIQSQRGENGQVLISVSDTGRGSAATEGGAEAGLEAQGLAAAQAGGLDPFHQVEVLGQLEIFDPNLAVNNNLACSYCHDPAAGYGNGSSVLSVFTGGSNPGSASITVHGAFPNNRIAKRSPNSYVYAPYFPPLQHNITQRDFYGGNFWDARATGYRLQNSAAEQGQDPPVDPEEMANPDTACVVWKLSLSNYKFFFEQVWGTGSLDIAWPSDVSTKHSPVDRVIAAAPTHDPVQITAAPELETVNDTLAIIRWTSTKPGGTDLHYGIVHYGTDATNLSQVAKSPNRRNSSHPDMIFRVRVAGLKPQTTYYYTVESTSATAVNDGVSSRIRTFKTR